MQYYFQEIFTDKMQRHYKNTRITNPINKKTRGLTGEKDERFRHNGEPWRDTWTLPGVLAQGRNQRDKFSKTHRYSPGDRTPLPGIRPEPAANHSLRPPARVTPDWHCSPLQTAGFRGVGRADGLHLPTCSSPRCQAAREGSGLRGGREMRV